MTLEEWDKFQNMLINLKYENEIKINFKNERYFIHDNAISVDPLGHGQRNFGVLETTTSKIAFSSYPTKHTDSIPSFMIRNILRNYRIPYPDWLDKKNTLYITYEYKQTINTKSVKNNEQKIKGNDEKMREFSSDEPLKTVVVPGYDKRNLETKVLNAAQFSWFVSGVLQSMRYDYDNGNFFRRGNLTLFRKHLDELVNTTLHIGNELLAISKQLKGGNEK